MNNLYWYVGPWVWATGGDGAYWAPPAGSRGCLDARSLPQQTIAGGTPGLGIFVTDGVMLGPDYELLGTGAHRDIKTSQRLKDRIPKVKKQRQPEGDDLLVLLLDLLTDGSDPTGDDGPKPLIPNTRGQIELSIAGLRHSERIRPGRRHWGKVLDVIRADMEVTIEDAQRATGKAAEHHRRVLDAMCEKYRTNNWQQFVKPNRVSGIPGRLPHETTYADNFNRANSGSLGTASGGFEWSTISGSWSISSNRAVAGAVNSIARINSDLSSADAYSELTITSYSKGTYAGALSRQSSSADTFYYFRRDNALNRVDLFKRIAGNFSLLGFVNSVAAAPTTVRTVSNGSTISGIQDSAESVSVTDTAITGNLRAGMRDSPGGAPLVDNFEASDISSGGGIVYTQLERNTRGLHRGVYIGF